MGTADQVFDTQFFENVLRKNPQYTDVIELLGGLYTQQGRIDEGLKMDRKLVRLAPNSPEAHYNLACSLALKERKADAVESLITAIRLGYSDIQWLIGDPDLRSLKDYPAFIDLIKTLRKQP